MPVDYRGVDLNNPLRKRPHNVLVFNGIRQRPVDVFFHFIQSVFEKIGLPLTKFGYDKTPYKSLVRSKKKLFSLLPDLKNLSLVSLPEGVEHSFEYCFSEASIGYPPGAIWKGYYGGTVFLGLEADRIPLRSRLWYEFADSLLREYKPKYGFVFQRAFDHGPYGYAMGISIHNLYPEEDFGGKKEYRLNWCTFALHDDLYLKNGWLREVYPWNFLCDAQLNAPVGNLTLREWILQTKDRGTLTPITDEMTLWDVPDDRLAEIDEQLLVAGRVFDYMRDIVNKLPATPAMSMAEAVSTVAEAFGFDSPDEVEIRKGDNKPISEQEKKRIFKRKDKN